MHVQEPIQVRMERLSLAWRAIPVSIVATLVNAALLLYLQQGMVRPLFQASWFSLLLSTTLLRLISLRYARRRLEKEELSDKLEHIFHIGVWLNALLWAMAAWLFTPADSMAHQAFTVMIFAGLSSGAMSSLSSLPVAFRTFVLVMLLPLVARLVYLGSEIHLAMALLITFFMIFVLANGKRQFAVLQDSLVFRFRSEQLTENLEQEKAATERLNQALEETQRDARFGTWRWHINSDRVSGSQSFYDIFNLPANQPLGMAQLQARIHDEDRELFQKLLQQARDGEQAIHFEHRIVVGDDCRVIHERWQTVDGVPNQPGTLEAICQDITPLKVADRLKDEFVATVSHELRTPLTSIMGSLGILRHEKLSQVANRKEMLDIAYANSKRLQTLINDLLDISKIESGKLAMNLAPVHLSGVVDETVLINRAYAEKFKVTLVVDNRMPAPEPRVEADENRLIQVINNLLSNAIKFSHHGAEVRIVFGVLYDRVRLSVVDRGSGFDSTFKDEIFDKFTQYRTQDINQKQPGTGLGLSIAKSIIEQMGGTIACDSTPGQGSTFYFELPTL